MRARRLAPLAALVALLALPAAASAGTPVGQPLLPDLIQVPPPTSSIQVAQVSNGHYVMQFDSIVGNVGAGPFEMHGELGADAPDMTAYQVAWTSPDGSTKEQFADPIGKVHYETDPTHNHWHFQPFDDYELRSLDGSQVWTDQKEGFCLVDFPRLPAGTPTVLPGPSNSYYTIGDPGDTGYFCYQADPSATEITEGISVGWSDEYAGWRGGTDVDLTGVPAGRYDLVQQVNMSHAIQELDYTNNAWSAVVDISYPNGPSGQPAAVVRTTCPGVATCSYTDPPPPPPPDPVVDMTPPKLLLGGATRQRFLRGRAIYVYAKCNEVCTVRASGRIAALQIAKSLRTSSTKLTLKPGVRTKIKLPISKRTRAIINRQLRRGTRVVVRVSLVVTDASGNRSTSTRTLRLLRNR